MHGTEEKMKNFNMMKKLLALTLGAAMLLAVMTGCGKKDTAQEPADDQQQQQEEQQSTSWSNRTSKSSGMATENRMRSLPISTRPIRG